MDSPTQSSLESVLSSFRAAVSTSPQLRQAIHQLGAWLMEISRSGAPPAPVPPAGHVETQVPPPASAAPFVSVYQPKPIRGPIEVVIAPEAAAAALQRGLGTGSVSPRHLEPVALSSGSVDLAPAIPVPRADFKVIQQRCRLKVAACDFSRRHDEHHAAGGTFEQLRAEYEGLITKGKALHDCYLWMVNPRSLVEEPALLAEIRMGYVNLADAAAMMTELSESYGEGHWPDEALWLLAEAQSSLYVSLARGPFQHPDADQLTVYAFVRDEARRRRLFMDQFLSEDAPADPARAPDLADHIAAARKAWEVERRAAKLRKNAIGKVEYEAQQLIKCAPDDREDHARKIEEGVRGFLDSGGPSTSHALVHALTEVRAALADLLAPDSIVWKVPEARAEREPAAPEEEDSSDDRVPGPELLRTRELLRSKVVLFIGGEERAQHARRLEQAFELRELRWAAHREHTSLAPLEYEIAREDIDLVLLPIRWNGTETGPQIRTWCKLYRKPCITLKAGYNANQVAHAVLEQVSDRLAASRSAQPSGPSYTPPGNPSIPESTSVRA